MEFVSDVDETSSLGSNHRETASVHFTEKSHTTNGDTQITVHQQEAPNQ